MAIKRIAITLSLLVGMAFGQQGVVGGRAKPGARFGANLPTGAEQWSFFIKTSGTKGIYVCGVSPCASDADWIAPGSGVKVNGTTVPSPNFTDSSVTWTANLETGAITGLASPNVGDGVSPGQGVYFSIQHQAVDSFTTQVAARIYSSVDGINFSPLNEATIYKGIGTPDRAHMVGPNPDIIKIGDTYYIVSQVPTEGQYSFGILKSQDLQTWTFVGNFNLAPGAVSQYGQWACDWVSDEDNASRSVSDYTKVYLTCANDYTTYVFEGDTYNYQQPYITHPTNASLTTWAAETAITITGKTGTNIGIYDPLIYRRGSTYYLFTSDLVGQQAMLSSATSIGGPYTFIKYITAWGWGEGFSVARSSSSTYRVYYHDTFAGAATEAQNFESYSETSDFDTFATSVPLPSLNPQAAFHGSVIRFSDFNTNVLTGILARTTRLPWKERHGAFTGIDFAMTNPTVGMESVGKDQTGVTHPNSTPMEALRFSCGGAGTNFRNYGYCAFGMYTSFSFSSDTPANNVFVEAFRIVPTTTSGDFYFDVKAMTFPATYVPATGRGWFGWDSGQDQFCAVDHAGNKNCLTAAQGGGITGTFASGALLKGLSANSTVTAAAASDVVALFNSGTCSGLLKSDGTCETAITNVGSGGVTTTYLSTSARTVTFGCYNVGTGTSNALQDTDDVSSCYHSAVPLHIIKVWCKSDAGTPRIQVVNNGNNVLADNTNAGLDCSSTGTSSTSFQSTRDAVSADVWLDFNTVSASTAHWWSIFVTATRDTGQ